MQARQKDTWLYWSGGRSVVSRWLNFVAYKFPVAAPSWSFPTRILIRAPQSFYFLAGMFHSIWSRSPRVKPQISNASCSPSKQTVHSRCLSSRIPFPTPVARKPACTFPRYGFHKFVSGAVASSCHEINTNAWHCVTGTPSQWPTQWRWASVTLF